MSEDSKSGTVVVVVKHLPTDVGCVRVSGGLHGGHTTSRTVGNRLDGPCRSANYVGAPDICVTGHTIEESRPIEREPGLIAHNDLISHEKRNLVNYAVNRKMLTSATYGESDPCAFHM